MASFLKATMASSSSLKPPVTNLLPLKWRRNSVFLRATQIPLLPSIKKSTTTSTGGGFSTVQCVMNNSNQNCFFMEEEEEERKRNQKNRFERFAEVMVEALKVPAVIALMSGKVLGWIGLLFWLLHVNDPSTAASRTAIIVGVSLVYDLYRLISFFIRHSRRRNSDHQIEGSISMGLGVILIAIAAFLSLFGLMTVSLEKPSSSQKETSVDDTQKSSTVLKLQVALLGTTRSLQRDLDRIRIAGTADTSTSEGFSQVLQETTSALLRHPDYCISGYSSVDVKQNKENGQKHFNKLSIKERGESDAETLVNVITTGNIKIFVQNKEDGQKLFNKLSIEKRGESDAETLVNVNTTKRQSTTSNIKIIVITMLVAAEGVHELPAIKGCADLKDALQKLGSIPSSKTMAVKVLWTPRNENDTLTERELLEDYPLLSPL